MGYLVEGNIYTRETNWFVFVNLINHAEIPREKDGKLALLVGFSK